jgi:hypothetical protein
MSQRRPECVILAAIAIGLSLLGAAPAFAGTPYVDGISDQNVTYWNGGVWNGGPPASPFARFLGSTLVDTPAQPLRFARYVVAYDVMCDQGGGAYRDFRAWLQDVRALGLTPVVAFWYGDFDGNSCATLPPIPGTVAQYADPALGVAAFLHAFPSVRIVEAWNEPNDGTGPDVTAATAAGFWSAAEQAGCTANTCDTVIAGDFDDAQANLVAYEQQYVAALGGVDPVDWGIHPYESVNSQTTTPLSQFYGALPNPAGDRVWYTEVAAYYCTPTRNTQTGFTPDQLQQAQEASAHYLVSTLMQYPFDPVHVFYYELMYKNNLAAPCAERDSAIFGPSGAAGSAAFAARSAAQDILPLAVPAPAAAVLPPTAAPGSQLVFYPGADWQIWGSLWRATSFG